jgi:hypothetical protein
MARFNSIFVGLACVLTSIEAVQYGNNHAPVRKDSDIVEANFADPNVTLLSPAFMNPESVPADFSNGSSGPTDDYEMGTSVRHANSFSLTIKTTS